MQLVFFTIIQYYFPLYDCPNEDIYRASKEDCIDISTGALQWIWLLIMYVHI